MPDTILAFDFGHRRIGVAVGQDITASASPLGVIRNSDAGVDRAHIDALIREWQPTTLVVGKPLHADGSDSDMTADARRFAESLRSYGLPVVLTDERFSSVEAERQLKTARSAGQRGRISKEDIDAAAAVTIAERYLAGAD
ncbi:MAG: Holliday junction resolvase RuvX [Pseudomonadota bacterium]